MNLSSYIKLFLNYEIDSIFFEKKLHKRSKNHLTYTETHTYLVSFESESVETLDIKLANRIVWQKHIHLF